MLLREDGARFYAKIVPAEGRALASYEVVMEDRLGLRVEPGFRAFEKDAEAVEWLRQEAGVHGFSDIAIERPEG